MNYGIVVVGHHPDRLAQVARWIQEDAPDERIYVVSNGPTASWTDHTGKPRLADLQIANDATGRDIAMAYAAWCAWGQKWDWAFFVNDDLVARLAWWWTEAKAMMETGEIDIFGQANPAIWLPIECNARKLKFIRTSYYGISRVHFQRLWGASLGQAFTFESSDLKIGEPGYGLWKDQLTMMDSDAMRFLELARTNPQNFTTKK